MLYTAVEISESDEEVEVVVALDAARLVRFRGGNSSGTMSVRSEPM